MVTPVLFRTSLPHAQSPTASIARTKVSRTGSASALSTTSIGTVSIAGSSTSLTVWLFLAAAGRPTGTAAEFCVVPAGRAVPLPADVGFDAGASLGVPALTAHRALTVAEVALGTNLALDLAVLRPRGTIATYANEGGRPVALDVGQHLVRNTRLQFMVLFTAGPRVQAAAVEDVTAALHDGALPVGAEHGLPLARFPLARTADAHRAVEAGTVGKVLVDVHG